MERKKTDRRKPAVILTACLLAAVLIVTLCLYFFYFKYTSEGGDYNIVQIDLSVKPDGVDARFDYLYDFQTVDFGDGGENYLAHPDSILLNRGTENETVFTCYASGHGRGALNVKTTKDGLTYSERVAGTPESWKYSEETPTLYELDFVDGSRKLILISANPKWCGYKSGDGFNVSLSDDEGETWTELKEAPCALCGDRIKAEYLHDGRLFVTFRSIERDKAKIKANGGGRFISEGWIAWVGTFDNLVRWYNGDKSSEGQYRIKLAHSYNAAQSAPAISANGDTGYSGLVVLRDGTVVVSSYGRFSADSDKTYIISKRINIPDTDALFALLKR